MLSYFPAFYEDELLYSAIARYHRHTLARSWKATQRELHGNSNALAIVDFPCRLDAFKHCVGRWVSESAEEIAWHRTLLPFYSAFVNTERQRELVRAMRDVSLTSSPYALLGMGFQRVPFPTVMRTCPRCLAEDRAAHGESYWRRAHQLQGVHFCMKHKVPLVETDIPFRPVSRQAASCADLDMVTRSYLPRLSAADETMLFDLSILGVSLLKRGLLQSSHEQVENYRERMRPAGFMKNSSRVDYVALLAEFKSFYSADVLVFLHSDIDADDCHNWLRLITRPGRESNVPVRHLLVHHFLEAYATRPTIHPVMPAGPWLCQNPAAPHFGKPTLTEYTLTERKGDVPRNGRFACSCGFEFVARLGDVDQKGQPVRRLVTKYGAVFEEKVRALLANGFTRSAIRRTFKIDMKIVHRIADGTTRARQHNGTIEGARAARLHQKRPALQNARRVEKAVVDWTARDAELSERVISVAAQLARNEPPARVSANAIARAVGQRSLNALIRKGNLPKTKESLEQVVESIDSAQCRRIQWEFERWPADVPLTASALRYSARVGDHAIRGAAVKLVEKLTAAREPFAVEFNDG